MTPYSPITHFAWCDSEFTLVHVFSSTVVLHWRNSSRVSISDYGKVFTTPEADRWFHLVHLLQGSVWKMVGIWCAIVMNNCGKLSFFLTWAGLLRLLWVHPPKSSHGTIPFSWWILNEQGNVISNPCTATVISGVCSRGGSESHPWTCWSQICQAKYELVFSYSIKMSWGKKTHIKSPFLLV